jgi:hypothetical protein
METAPIARIMLPHLVIRAHMVILIQLGAPHVTEVMALLPVIILPQVIDHRLRGGRSLLQIPISAHPEKITGKVKVTSEFLDQILSAQGMMECTRLRGPLLRPGKGCANGDLWVQETLGPFHHFAHGAITSNHRLHTHTAGPAQVLAKLLLLVMEAVLILPHQARLVNSKRYWTCPCSHPMEALGCRLLITLHHQELLKDTILLLLVALVRTSDRVM